MLAHFRRLLSDRAGNFGMITALLAVPVTAAAGLALDLTHALSLRTQLYAAADAAAVGAISPNAPALLQAMAMAGDGTVTVGSDDGQNIFISQMSGEISDMPLDLQVTVTKTAGVIESYVTFQAVMPTTFLKVLGRDSVTLGGKATARYQTPAFLDFYMLLDNTPSMGVGATPDDVAKLIKETKNGTDGKGKDANCAFACHIVSTDGVEDKSSYYYLAKEIGATIRIDVVADATAALMQTAKQTQTVPGQFRMAAYTFGQSALDTKLFTVSEPTIDFDAVSKATQAITLMSIPSHDYPNNQTDYDAVLGGINGKIKATGAGTSTADRQSIVFFVADGVGDAVKKNCSKKKQGNRCMEPVNIEACDALKVRGIKVAVLYTTYLPLMDNPFYVNWIWPFQNEIPTKMEACATPGYYFEVTPNQGIEDAMNALFRKIVSTPRITS